MPMIPLGLKETKDIDFRDPFKVRVSHTPRGFHSSGGTSELSSLLQIFSSFVFRPFFI